jgi:hypothetical protein
MDEKTGAQVPSPGTQQDETKAFSERLKATREKDRAELAAALGFDSWDAAMNSGLDKKLLDAGIEPSVGKPIIEDAVANHPEVIKARQIAAQAEQAQKAAELELLNERHGLQYKNIDDLDQPVKDLLAKGVPLSQAYVAVHYEELSNKQTQDPAKAGKAQLDQSLKHMGGVPGAGAAAPTEATSISQADITNVKRFMPGATEEQIAKFLAAHPEIKK